jgi:hypothetical protein
MNASNHFVTCAPSFTQANQPAQAALYSIAVVATIRELFYQHAMEESCLYVAPNLLFLDEDTFLALEYWHHRFHQWEWNALRRLHNAGDCHLDFGHGLTQLLIVPVVAGQARVMELATANSEDLHLLRN